MHPVLLGNSFPLTHVRRPARIEPRPLDELRRAVAERGVVSFWGHDNTLAAARQFLGFDPTPASHRPALSLDANLLPALDGVAFDEVWVLSPDFPVGSRQDTGEESPADHIAGWQVLRITFDSNKETRKR